MSVIEIKKGTGDRITVTFPYNPDYVEKVKAIKGHWWHPEEKHWSFPNSDGTLEKVLKVFEGEEIHIDPVLQAMLFPSVIANSFQPKHSWKGHPISTFSDYNFEDLRRELVSRKYSYKTVKAYI